MKLQSIIIIIIVAVVVVLFYFILCCYVILLFTDCKLQEAVADIPAKWPNVDFQAPGVGCFIF